MLAPHPPLQAQVSQARKPSLVTLRQHRLPSHRRASAQSQPLRGAPNWRNHNHHNSPSRLRRAWTSRLPRPWAPEARLPPCRPVTNCRCFGGKHKPHRPRKVYRRPLTQLCTRSKGWSSPPRQPCRAQDHWVLQRLHLRAIGCPCATHVQCPSRARWMVQRWMRWCLECRSCPALVLLVLLQAAVPLTCEPCQASGKHPVPFPPCLLPCYTPRSLSHGPPPLN
mmetsp:Transcript_111442/g.279072  ORF Transcript_111442/g.279072 Transcript_111442/m.279072 type:complete len:223 (-) Transcript_111442:120-788(-)